MLSAFCNAVVYTGEKKVEGNALLIDDGIIVDFVDIASIPAEALRIDVGNVCIAPGLIDLQIYGGGGYLFSNDPSALALHTMADAVLASGTTGFLMTLATNSDAMFDKAIEVVRENPHPAVMGLHFEGPFLNPVKRGAHLARYIRQPARVEVEALLERAGGLLKMITLAPEVCDPEIIDLLKEQGVVISAGHSNATYEEAVRGFERGITTTTHLFNAMSPLHHRDTGLPGAAFMSKGVFASIIADGIHVDYHTLAISKKMMKERLFLITDAVEEVRQGAYEHVRSEDRFTLPDGTLSGSSLTLLKAVRNCVRHGGIALEEALRMASTYPASVINAAGVGKIEIGYKANLVVFTSDLELKYTVLEGNIINKKRDKKLDTHGSLS
ncbi:MAG TPA: N-acetylglucosamine-6-phosphate deacetylase [Puia sp.]